MRTQNSEARIQNSEGNAHPLASHFVSAQLRLHPRWAQNAQIAAVQHSGYWILNSEFSDQVFLVLVLVLVCRPPSTPSTPVIDGRRGGGARVTQAFLPARVAMRAEAEECLPRRGGTPHPPLPGAASTAVTAERAPSYRTTGGRRLAAGAGWRTPNAQWLPLYQSTA